MTRNTGVVGTDERLPAPPADGMLWDIATPTLSSRLPGVTMAGFTDRGITPPALRLIPHPAVTLIVVFDGSIAVEDGDGRPYRGSFAIGPGYGDALRALQVDAFSCLQVRLSPVAAHALLGGSAAELDTVIPLDALLGPDSDRLNDRLAAAGTWQQRFAVLDRWFSDRRAAAGSPIDPEVGWSWQRIASRRGAVRVEQLATELGWSRKRLWSRFGSQLGLSPKRAAKLVRFDHAVHRLVAGGPPALVAAEGGYADQSHLHRDVAAFTGLTPGTVTAEPFLAVDDVAWGWPGRGG
ncbi:AraC family transcriptional regulator [Microlunatus soli]|uniref:Helix-turn-helix domain-containing protein n=1 Tax=Microlunatus soli TaxID=630515 RepID=A0A1H2AGF9_9ACTN|nr:helix-turn-helix domain-containing protein [Microlunatus soli]SDT45041.1 Helix-turn-helix domain-containing protein [Microlunatus soli]